MPISHDENLLLSSLGDTNAPGKRVVSYAANQSVRPYSTNQEYLYAMREDLADWLKDLYAVEIDAVSFFEQLETGTLLCQHANSITACAEYMQKNNRNVKWSSISRFPTKILAFHQGRYVRSGSFFARDNIASFIGWCRNELQIADAVMFETNDLVLRHNEKNVILCLLEVARRGSKFGVPAPVLVQMEEEIDEEIEIEKVAKERNEAPPKIVKHKTGCDFKSLDEMVQYILGMCTCPSQFPMVKVSDGKYKVGDSENLIFMRILRQHVMVRVGGGWDTLEHYLNKHDPCRCQKHKTDRAFTPRHGRSQSATRTANHQPQQHQRSLTSTAVITKPSISSSKTLPIPERMTRSSANLTELTPSGKDESRPSEKKRSTQQSRKSITSDTSSSDKRSLSSRFSNSADKNSVFRNSTSKHERLSLQSDVFKRLSRPKSTPPISRPLSMQQDEFLVVQRNKKGSHQVQRTSTPSKESLKLTNAKTSERSRTRSSDISFLRSKSSAALTTTSRGDDSVAGQRKQRQKRTFQTSQTSNNGQSLGTNTARSSRMRSKSVTRDIEARERELLQAFEKECINNRYSLQHQQPKSIPRQSSIDSLLDGVRLSNALQGQLSLSIQRHLMDGIIHRQQSFNNKRNLHSVNLGNRVCVSGLKPLQSQRLASCTSSEDNEVALHMEQAVNNVEPKSSHPPPSSYSSLSLPRPRKDKREQHDRRTRIPTPVSFNKPLLANKSIDFVEEKSKPEKIKASEVSKNEMDQQISEIGRKKSFVNGIDHSDDMPSPSADSTRPRISLSLDKINRLLNSNKFDFENVTKPDSQDVQTDKVYVHQPDSIYLRSSGHTNNKASRASQFSFVPVESRYSKATQRQPSSVDNTFPSENGHQQTMNHLDGLRDYNSSTPAKNDFNHHLSGHHRSAGETNMNSRLPAHIMKACGLAPTPSFEPEVRNGGLRVSTNLASKSNEPQWV